MRNIADAALEVPGRVERVGRMDLGAVIATVDDAARVPERPPRHRSGALDASRRRLQEIELIDWVVVDGAAEDGEQDEKNRAEDEDEGRKSQERPYCASIVSAH